MDVMQYIKPELMLVIPICLGIGAALKRTPHIADWTIPYLLLGIGIFISGLYVFAVDGVCPMSAFTAITQGALLSIASVGGNQLVKQYGKKDENESD